MRSVVCGCLLGFATLAAADQIVPVNHPTPVQVAYSLQFTVPAGATQIVGWGAWVHFIQPSLTAYVAIQWWHDGGTPHMLDEINFYPGKHTWQGPIFLPAGDGHAAVPGDAVFVIMTIVRTNGQQLTTTPGWAVTRPTFYFRVP